MSKKLYANLGIAETASQDEVRTAFRNLAKEHHPDLNPGDKEAEERFKEISAAFEILGDEDSRRRYDSGEIDEAGAERQKHQFYRHYADTDRTHHYTSAGGFEDFVDVADLFGDLFAERARARGQSTKGTVPIRGADAAYHLAVDFMEAATGAKKRVTMPDGRTLDISIPAGIDSGQMLRLRGQGQVGFNGGPNGDALVTIAVQHHKIFERDGLNLLIDVPIGLDEAVLGGKVEIPTLSGRVAMKVPKGASSGQLLRLRGKGIRNDGKQGDLLARLKIVSPPNVDDELAEFMKSWRVKHPYDPRAGWEDNL